MRVQPSVILPLVDVLEAAAAGLGSAVFMTLFELPFWKKWGMTGVVEWQVNWMIVSKLTRRNSNQAEEPKISWTIASHLSHGVAAGIAFGVLLPFLTMLPVANLSILLDAVGYSTVLWVIFSVVLRKTYESAGIRVSDRGVLVALFSHFVYGMVLGLLFTFA